MENEAVDDTGNRLDINTYNNKVLNYHCAGGNPDGPYNNRYLGDIDEFPPTVFTEEGRPRTEEECHDAEYERTSLGLL